MTIPTRDELIERIADCQWNGMVQVRTAVLFTDEQIRRAVAETLEALRECALEASDVACVGEEIDARLAALRAEQTEPGAATAARLQEHAADTLDGTGDWKPTVTRVAPQPMPTLSAGNVAAPALSDADVLEHAAEILRGRGCECLVTEGVILEHAAKLRAASAPVPVPEPVDVFEAFSVAWAENGGGLKGIARDWFGPLDQLLSEIEAAPGAWQTRAAATRAALRQRAQEASR